jgi:hypothetical protein
VRSPRSLPAFSLEPWYADPRDHRCPHDASLEVVEIKESASGSPNMAEPSTIVLKLLGAYHNGWITLTYEGVRHHTLSRYQCDQGLGGWLRDEFALTDDGLIAHRITWHSTAGGTSHWVIEAENVSYRWESTAKG